MKTPLFQPFDPDFSSKCSEIDLIPIEDLPELLCKSSENSEIKGESFYSPENFYISAAKCTKRFRHLVAKTYPALGNDKPLWALMQHLLYSSFHDKSTGNLVVDRYHLAAFCDYRGDLRNFCAVNLLFRFKEMEPSLEWNEHDYINDKARQIVSFDPPSEILTALDREAVAVAKNPKELVYFKSGKAFTKAERAKTRREAIRHSAGVIQDTFLPPEAVGVLDYLNNLPVQPFTALLSNMEAANEAAMAIDNVRSRKHQLRLLLSIALDPQPKYAPSRNGKTVRIFGTGQCITNQKKEIRKILTANQWVDADLANSQLAICAVDWTISYVQDFLADLPHGKKVWDYFYEELGIPANEREGTKPAFKETLYSILFGMHEANVMARLPGLLREKGIDSDRGEFFNLRLIRELFCARNRRLREINRDGGGETCFGQKLILNEDMNAPSILAQISQSKELAILLPIFEIAKNTDDFKIVLWSHDGFSVKFSRKDRELASKEVLNKDVSARIEEYGVNTFLEWER